MDEWDESMDYCHRPFEKRSSKGRERERWKNWPSVAAILSYDITELSDDEMVVEARKKLQSTVYVLDAVTESLFSMNGNHGGWFLNDLLLHTTRVKIIQTSKGSIYIHSVFLEIFIQKDLQQKSWEAGWNSKRRGHHHHYRREESLLLASWLWSDTSSQGYVGVLSLWKITDSSLQDHQSHLMISRKVIQTRETVGLVGIQIGK